MIIPVFIKVYNNYTNLMNTLNILELVLSDYDFDISYCCFNTKYHETLNYLKIQEKVFRLEEADEILSLIPETDYYIICSENINISDSNILTELIEKLNENNVHKIGFSDENGELSEQFILYSNLIDNNEYMSIINEEYHKKYDYEDLSPSDIFSIFNTDKVLNLDLETEYNTLYYYTECECRNNYNFGDYITPYIYYKLTGKEAIHNINGNDVIYGAGSIMFYAEPTSIVWGTGCIEYYKKLKKPKKILSVRGPNTQKNLQRIGIPCPEVYGDIGLILPYFYYPDIEIRYKVGIIPHYVDYEYLKSLYPEEHPEILIIDVSDPIETVIENILSCEITMSSSLHGIIVSHAYNKRCMWIRMSNKIWGGNFKFRDYYGSINQPDYLNILPYILNKKISLDEMIELINNYPNPEFPLNTKHIIELCPFIYNL